jgi:hypothetical protein
MRYFFFGVLLIVITTELLHAQGSSKLEVDFISKKDTARMSVNFQPEFPLIYDADDSIILHQIDKPNFSDSGYSSVAFEQHEDTSFHTNYIRGTYKTRSYHHQDYYQYFPKGGEALQTKLIVETSTQIKPNDNDMNAEGKIQLSVWQSSGLKILGKSWNKTFDANEIKYNNRYFESVTYNEYPLPPEVHEIFRYIDGRSVLRSNSGFFQVVVYDQSVARYIGYYNDLKFEKGFDPDEVSTDGVLSFVDPATNQTQKLILRVKPKAWEYLPYEAIRYGGMPKVSLSLTPLGAKDRKEYDGGERLLLYSKRWSDSAFTNFKINIKFEGYIKTTVSIPVKNGKLDISGLRSKWFDFELQ